MIKTAIVDDYKKDYDKLVEALKNYSKEFGEEFSYEYFDNGLAFLENYKPYYDIIFMDIEMPHIDGIEISAKIREIDTKVCIIIVSNSAQYAVKGYSVDAYGYIVKPITALNFNAVIKKAIEKIKKDNSDFLILTIQGDYRKILMRDIKYIEVMNHDLFFHSEQGVFKKRDVLRNYEDKLEKHGFSKCDKSFLINLNYVDDIIENEVIVGSENIKISRTRKKQFVEDYVNFLGDNI